MTTQLPPSPVFGRPVFLIGFMGAGKTTLGRALARRRPGCVYVDLDEEVERRAGVSIPEIFATRGEAAFRCMESEALRDLGAAPGTIVGCGGGTPCQPGNMELMSGAGVTVLLRASDDALLRRLLAAPGQRPLVDGMDADSLLEYIRAEQARREPHYSRADIELPSDNLETAAGIEETCAALERLLAERAAL